MVGVKEEGAIVAKDVSEDHKPDSPLEKVPTNVYYQLPTDSSVFIHRFRGP